MDNDLYDEFGNFIGDSNEEINSDNESIENIKDVEMHSQSPIDVQDENHHSSPIDTIDIVDNEVSIAQTPTAIVLHEDKQYYPTPQQLYGDNVEVVLHEQDTQPLSEPIIAPIKNNKISLEDVSIPQTNYSLQFLTDLQSFPQMIRNIAVAGHLHHGKSSLIDMLVSQTHEKIPEKEKVRKNVDDDQPLRYTDTTVLERNRGLTLKASPISFVLQDLKGKSRLFNFIDTPGHVNFIDETTSALRLVDGVLLVVDAVEGVLSNTEHIIQLTVSQNIPITLIINKIDRLIFDLRLPPSEAYYKLKLIISHVNKIIQDSSSPISTSGDSNSSNLQYQTLSPQASNVLFASTQYEWIFSLESFAKKYSVNFPDLDYKQFASLLWGDVFYSSESNKLLPKSDSSKTIRTFVHFILNPLYKISSYTVGEDPPTLKKLLKSLDIDLKPAAYKLNSKELLKLVFAQFFGDANCLADAITKNVLSPIENAKNKLQHSYTGPLDSEIASSMIKCDSSGPTVVHIAKLFPSSDGEEFYALGRVMSGTIQIGTQIRVLGENFTLDDDEDSTTCPVTGLWIPQTRYKIPVSSIPAGNMALIRGVDSSLSKTGTIVPVKWDEDVYVFKPINYGTLSVLKVAVEAINPAELPKLLNGLRMINKSYPLAATKVEESGEHVLLGTGELYMDCILYELRNHFAEMDVKVSDPVTSFCETIVDSSAVKCYAETPNKKNKISIVAEPLEAGIGNDIESGKISIAWPSKKLGKYFEKNYDWDILAGRSIWAFGPDDQGPNILQDDTIPDETDKKLLNSIRESIKQGFQWAVREGPLCEEPIRNSRFKLTDADIAKEPLLRGGGQIIPTARRVCYSAFLMASPRLLEPIYAAHILGPQDMFSVLNALLAKRRGHVVSDGPVPGTPLYIAHALLPVIDSFGFEVDLRVATQGEVQISMLFDKWQVVPGDPLDKSIKVHKLTAATGQQLARDFVLKTRRRKGLSEEPTIQKYLDESLFKLLTESGLLS